MTCVFVRIISYVVNIIRHAKSSMIPSFIEFYFIFFKKKRKKRKKKKKEIA